MKKRIYDSEHTEGPWSNRLMNAKSHYLQLHGDQPIDWYEWGEEAFKQAKALNRPILISVGYASCHWCHVMARESFSNPRIAQVLNEFFIAIKVDREELPEVDAFCIQSLLQIQGDAGWPANIFVSPECVPFMGGTYYPPHYQYGLPGFQDVLSNVRNLWANQPDRMTKTGTEILDGFKRRPKENTEIRLILSQWESELDTRKGGFGWGAKFPMIPRLDFILTQSHHSFWKAAATLHLDAMDKGGIHDHVGGGFHRYAVDTEWEVPHFEKMLCDNALIARAFFRFHALYPNPHFRAVACDTLEWMLKVLKDEDGLFAASVDAEDAQGEGYFYTWTREELRSLLGSKAEAFITAFSVSEYGNTDLRRSTLVRTGHPSIMASSRRLLQIEQAKRQAPRVDFKPISAWNAMSGDALCMGYRIMNDQRYLDAALNIGEKLLASCHPLVPRILGQEHLGTLEDQVWTLWFWLSLYSCTGEERWLSAVCALFPQVLDAFGSVEFGLQLQHPSAGLPISLQCADDYSEHSPVGIMMEVLLVLENLGVPQLNQVKIEELWSKLIVDLSAPTLCGVTSKRNSYRTVLVGTGKKGALWHESLKRWRPYTFVAPVSSFACESFEAKDGALDIAWICEGRQCQLPITDVKKLSI